MCLHRDVKVCIITTPKLDTGLNFRPEVQAIFEKYVSGNTRRLVRDDAINMLMSEFIIERKWAEQFFTHFDADSNDVFSLWEFQHFYHVVGNRYVLVSLHILCV